MRKLFLALALMTAIPMAAADAASTKCNRSGCHFEIRPW
jgi:hypothetical protein